MNILSENSGRLQYLLPHLQSREREESSNWTGFSIYTQLFFFYTPAFDYLMR